MGRGQWQLATDDRRGHLVRVVLPGRPNGTWQTVTCHIHLVGSEDMLGRVYEYFLSHFAAAAGKRGGAFYTTRCVGRLLVEMLEPYRARVYDPFSGSSGMLLPKRVSGGIGVRDAEKLVGASS